VASFFDREKVAVDLIENLLDAANLHRPFFSFVAPLWIKLEFDGYGPEVIEDPTNALPMFRFSYKGKVVEIAIRGTDGIIPGRREYCFFIKDSCLGDTGCPNYFRNIGDVERYIHKKYPMIQAKKDAVLRELRSE